MEKFYSDIPIFAKIYDFYKELYLSLGKFPKKHRYSLGQKLDDTTIDVFALFISAGSKGSNKPALLERANTKLEVLKLLLRLAKDTQSLDTKRYITLETSLQEIGRMLGGWIRATNAR